MMRTRKFALRVLTLAFTFLLLTQPFHAALIPPDFLDCVVALGRKDAASQWVPEASGFMYGRFLSKLDEGHNNYATYLVTNRHVVEEHSVNTGGGPLWVRFNLNTPGSAKEYDIPLINAQGSPAWHFHPNPSVDIAVIPINPQFLRDQGARFMVFRSDLDALSKAKAKEKDLSEGDGVFVLGFPMGLVGQREDYVIVRAGVIARVRDVLDSPGPGSFLIDSFIFPGSSGGPVILRPEMVSITGHPAIGNAYLVGVVNSYIPYTDMAVSLQTKHPRVTFEENSGLAMVIPIDHVDEAIADYERVHPPQPTPQPPVH
jgi:S1-C subfamily serine protease